MGDTPCDEISEENYISYSGESCNNYDDLSNFCNGLGICSGGDNYVRASDICSVCLCGLNNDNYRDDFGNSCDQVALQDSCSFSSKWCNESGISVPASRVCNTCQERTTGEISGNEEERDTTEYCSNIRDYDFITDGSMLTCDTYELDCDTNIMTCLDDDGNQSQITAAEVCDQCRIQNCNEISDDDFEDQYYLGCDYHRYYRDFCDDSYMTCLDESGNETTVTARDKCSNCELDNCDTINNDTYNGDYGLYTCNDFNSKDDCNYAYSSMQCINYDGQRVELTPNDVCNICKIRNCDEINDGDFEDQNGFTCATHFDDSNCDDSYMTCIDDTGNEIQVTARDKCNICQEQLLECSEITNDNYNDTNYLECNDFKDNSMNETSCYHSVDRCNGNTGEEFVYASDICDYCRIPKCNSIEDYNFESDNNEFPRSCANYYNDQRNCEIDTMQCYIVNQDNQLELSSISASEVCTTNCLNRPTDQSITTTPPATTPPITTPPITTPPITTPPITTPPATTPPITTPPITTPPITTPPITTPPITTPPITTPPATTPPITTPPATTPPITTPPITTPPITTPPITTPPITTPPITAPPITTPPITTPPVITPSGEVQITPTTTVTNSQTPTSKPTKTFFDLIFSNGEIGIIGYVIIFILLLIIVGFVMVLRLNN